MMRAMHAISAVLLAAGWLGCGGGELDDWGCHSDADCKHGRICVDGRCQDESARCQTDADCNAGETCFGGLCTVCDQDGDGVLGAQCHGGDCDDGNGGVHPGADELCGDDLDNDCDGVTDPASLCDARCAGVTCPDGYACDPDTGDCVPICTPRCAGRECGPDGCGGSCGTCQTGERCNGDGQCVSGCVDRCQAGEKACAGNAVVECVDTDNDGCVEWGTPSPCADGQTCRDGRCTSCVPDCVGRECGPDGCGGSCGTCPSDQRCDQTSGQCVGGCTDECFWGESRCVDPFSYQECGDWDEDPCTEFGEVYRCPDDAPCDPETGYCLVTCEDECWWGESYCVDEMGYVECGPWDGDPCLEFGPRLECPEGSFCDWNTGRCDGACEDECWWGESYCLDEWLYVECADWDGDGCAEFGQPMECPPDAPCDPMIGRCYDSCWDECWWGESYCIDEMRYVECGDWDNDACLEFGPPMYCDDDSWCDWETGRCVGSCVNECWWGDFRCESQRAYVYCGDFDGDGCLEWSPRERCPQGTFCSEDAGGCVEETCRDECQLGEAYCMDDWSYVECGWWDSDPCLEFGPVFDCPPDEPCDWWTGRCGGCTPMTCDQMNRQCGWWDDGCGQRINCGSCDAGYYCSAQGRCVPDDVHEGAGDPCGWWEPCPDDWRAAYNCVEYPGQMDGFCSFPCTGDDDCQNEFPGGCCREIAPGRRICVYAEYCQPQGPGYLEPCTASGMCDIDMFCVEPGGGSEPVCFLSCDRAMGLCPGNGQCYAFDEGAAVGLCIPAGNGLFSDPCTLIEGCVAGLMCLQLDEEHPGYCNHLCSDWLPCGNGFDCILDDGSGGTWCAMLCDSNYECERLGDWECVDPWSVGVSVCLPLPY
ncbi:MAG: hypothetical protein JXR96_29690 [Deltaproteobacteria bacterium]|nr:hypothetical protein [Deltaproteobacteria bacterium]